MPQPVQPTHSGFPAGLERTGAALAASQPIYVMTLDPGRRSRAATPTTGHNGRILERPPPIHAAHPRVTEFCDSLQPLGPEQWIVIARRYLDNQAWIAAAAEQAVREVAGVGRGLTIVEEFGRLDTASRLYQSVCLDVLKSVPDTMIVDGGEIPCRDIARAATVEALRGLLVYDAFMRRRGGAEMLLTLFAPFHGFASLPVVEPMPRAWADRKEGRTP